MKNDDKDFLKEQDLLDKESLRQDEEVANFVKWFENPFSAFKEAFVALINRYRR